MTAVLESSTATTTATTGTSPARAPRSKRPGTRPASADSGGRRGGRGGAAGLVRRLWASPLARWVSPIALIVLWQLASFVGLLPEKILPAPQLIAESGWELIRNGQLGEALLVSTGRVAQGLALGIVTGAIAGILVGRSRVADFLLDPPLQMLRALPHLGLIPLFILWFGIGETPKVLLIALGVFFPIYLTIAGAIRQIDPALLEVAEVFGFSRRQRLLDVILPSVAPQALVGLRQSLAIAWLTLIVAEQLNATSGLGFLIMNARDFLQVDVILVGLVVYALLGVTTDALVRVLERRALRHYH